MPEPIVNTLPFRPAVGLARKQSALLALGLFILVSVGSTAFTVRRLNLLQQKSLPDYLRAAAQLKKVDTYTFYLLQQHGTPVMATPDDVQLLDGHLVISDSAIERRLGPLRVVRSTLSSETACVYLRQYVFGDRPLREIFRVPILLTILAFLAIPFAGARDAARNRHLQLHGLLRRGPALMARPHLFNRAVHSDGIGFPVRGWFTLAALFTEPRWRQGRLRIPASQESSHILIMGDSGTGKSVLLRHLLREIAQRQEVAIVYDPAREFLMEFYDPDRGDVILNPLDARSPFWTPCDELLANAEALTLAKSLFPDKLHMNPFFYEAPRQIFAHLIQYQPTPAELISWLADPNQIDLRIKGTEIAATLAKGAASQRSGVLSAIGIALAGIRLLPPESECKTRWSALEWSKTRRGWIFLTSAPTTREAQLPLVSMWLDTLILRLMNQTTRDDGTTPVWLVMDELSTLQQLPTLQTALTEGRKHGIKMVLGIQGRAQLQKLYGHESAETLLSQPHTKIFLRTTEVNGSDWISRTIGTQDIEREKVTRSTANGKTTYTYATETVSERAASDSQIQELPNLIGYLQFERYVAPFRLKGAAPVQRVKGLEHRPTAGFVPLAIPGPYEVSTPDQALTPQLDQTPFQEPADLTALAAATGSSESTILPQDPDTSATEATEQHQNEREDYIL